MTKQPLSQGNPWFTGQTEAAAATQNAATSATCTLLKTEVQVLSAED